MPFINTNDYKAWQVLQNTVASGVFSNPDGLLLPKEMSWAEKIVLSEMGYQEAVNNGTDWNLLRQYKDFAELAGEREQIQPESVVLAVQKYRHTSSKSFG